MTSSACSRNVRAWTYERERGGALGGATERDSRLGRQRVGLRLVGGEPLGREVVARETAGQLVRAERLEVACRRQVPRPSAPSRASVLYATSRMSAWTNPYWPRPGERGSASRTSSSRRTSWRRRGSSASGGCPDTAARPATVKLCPRTAASSTSARSVASRPSRRAEIRAVSVSGTARSSRSPTGRNASPSLMSRPWARSIRTVSTAYSGTPSARATIRSMAGPGSPGTRPASRRPISAGRSGSR